MVQLGKLFDYMTNARILRFWYLLVVLLYTTLSVAKVSKFIEMKTTKVNFLFLHEVDSFEHRFQQSKN
jgi:hypothetical protein